MPIGGKRPGAGRKPGVPNKATAEVKSLARQYGAQAIKKLAEMAGLCGNKLAAVSEQARSMALRELLDRGYGRPETTVNVRQIRSISDLTEDELMVLAAEGGRAPAGKETQH